MDNCTRRQCNKNYTGVSARTGNTNNCDIMKKRLTEVEFAITEIVLYLDAYPECNQALEYYHRLIEERELLLESINSACGPLTHFNNISKESWQWSNGPWPWKYEAN